MRLEVRHLLHHVSRPVHPAHAPAGHGVGLGHAVDHDGLVLELGNLGEDVGHLALVHEVLVDFVRDHPQAVLERPLADRREFRCGVDRAGRVRRRAQQENLRALGQSAVELVERDLVVLVGAREYLNRDAAGQPDRLGVGGPVGGGQDDLVAVVEQRHERLVDGLLAAIGDDDVVRINLNTGVGLRLRGDCRAKLGQALCHGVLVVLRIRGSLRGRLNDVSWGGEVRLARAKTDDRLAFGLQGLRLGVDSEGC